MPRQALSPTRSTAKPKLRNFKYYSRIPLYGCLVAGILTADHWASAATTTLVWDTSTATTGAQDGAGTWDSTSSTWLNGSTDQAWTDSTALTPVIAKFGSASGTVASRTVTVSGSFQVNGLSFGAITGTPSATNPSYTLTGGTINFDTGGTITIGDSASNSTSLIILNSVLAGSNVTIQKAAGSTTEQLIQLSGANTWTGTLNIASGNGSIFVRATSASTLNTLDTVTVGNNNTLNLQGTTSYTSNFVVAGNGGTAGRGAIRFDANMTLTGSITMTGDTVLNFQSSTPTASNVTFTQGIGQQGGSFAFTKTGLGTLTLQGASTYTGSTTIGPSGSGVDPGSILLDFRNSTVTDNLLYNGVTAGTEGALFLTGNTARTSAASTATLTINGKDATANTQNFGGLTVNGPTAITVQSGLIGSMDVSLGAITRTVAGSTLSITAPASGNITTTTNNGSLLGTWATYTNPDGFSFWAGSDADGNIGAFIGDRTITSSASIDSTWANSNLAITNTSALAISQTGSVTVNTITLRDTAAANRTVTVGAGNTLTLGQTGGIQLVSGAHNLTIGAAGNAGTLTAGTTAGAELFLSNYDSLNTITINSVIANNSQGAVNLMVNGLGTTILNGANTYTGTTTINSGTLQIQSATALGTTAGTTIVGSGGTLGLAGGITVAEPITINGTGANGTGALRNVSGSNTYSGLISLGVSGTSITADAGSTLTLFRTSATTTVINNTANVVFGGAGTINVNSVIATSSASLTKADSGTLVLNAANTYTGSTAVTGGVLRVTNATGLGTVAAGTTVSSGATLELANNVTIGAEGLGLNGMGVNGNGALRSVGTNTYGGKITLGTAARINSDSGLLTLSNTNAVTGAFGLTFGGTGDIVLAAALTTGAGTLTKDGSGTLTLATANTYTGTTTISAGTIAMSGSDTFADSSSLLLDGGSLAMGAFNDTVASVSLRRGSITGTGTLTTTTTSAYAFQEGSISVNLVSTPITVGLAKTGSGTVTLSGTTNYTGATAINAGRLVLDYSSGNTVLSSASAINLSGGILEVKGASTPTAVTLGALTTTAAAGLSTVVVDANTAVTAASYTRSSGSELLIDLSATGSSMAFTAAPATKNGVLLGIGGSNAAVVMKDSNGRYDFASVGTGNTVVRLNATTALPTTVGNVNTSYVLTGTGNTFTLGANVATSTVRIDTTTAGGTLDLAGKVLSFDLFGLLVDGSNDFTITSSVAGGSLSGSNAVFIYQFGTGKLTLDTQITGSNPQTFLMGTGLLDWTAAAGNSGANYVLGLTVRLSGTGLSLGAGATGNGTGVLNLGNNGILELNSGDFTRAIGSAANGIVFYSGGAGFSAYGADRVVNIGGASAALSWGSGNFLASASKLILGSPYANATVDFQNPLGLNGGNQTVEVQSQNVTGVGGKISGVISGTGSFSKTGQGILTLSAANTYTGPTFVKAGTLLVSGSINGSAAVSVDANAELKLTGAGAVSGTTLTLADSSKLSLEVGTLTTAPITLTGSTILNGTVNLALTLTADPVDGTLFTLIDGSTPLLGYSSGARFAANGSALAEGASFLVTTGSFSQYFTISYIGGADGNDVTLLAIPEPSTLWTLCASVGLTLGISRFRRRRSPHLATVS